MGQVLQARRWRRASALGALGLTGAAALALTYGMPDKATSFGTPVACGQGAANCQLGSISGSVLALGSNGTTLFASDNFSVATGGQAITEICFWALYNSNVPGTDNIVVSIYNDSAATTTSPGYPTGPALASWSQSGATLGVTGPIDTGLDFAGLDVYEYTVTPTSAFTPSASTCYWIEISNAVTPADAWFILCADNTAGLGDQRSMQRDATVDWGYNDVATGADLAVCINNTGGMQLPSAVCAIPASCTTAGNDCNAESGSGGCSDPECCTLVCTLEPLCCSSAWDAFCVDLAINSAGCAVAPYSCPGGGPANDCATSPTALSLPSGSVAFDLTTANTDGASINANCGGGGSPATFDVWYTVTPSADGNITVDTCATDVGTDLVVNIHDLGIGGTPNGQDQLDETDWINCDDDGCCPASFGCPSLINFFCQANHTYLIRVGTWNGSTPGPGFISVDYDPTIAVWNTGPNSAGLLNGTPTNLGFSSGNLGGTSPERWQAHPFTLPPVPAGGATWHITAVQGDGFSPAGSVNETFHFIVWERTGINTSGGPPVNGDQIVTGMAAFPTPVGNTHQIETDFKLPAGDYWFTLYAAGNVTPNNFAWFNNAQSGPDGIPNLADVASGAIPADGQSFMWRSFCITPAGVALCGANPQGFQAYRAGGWAADTANGQDPDLLYTASFALLGEPQFEEPSCPQDCVTSATFAPPPDGIVDGADLANLLGSWGLCPACCADTVTSATFQPPPDNVVDGADLAALLGAWGNPGCP